MASSSSSPSRTWNNSVFASFHGPDVLKTFLILQKQLNANAITMLYVQGIDRGQNITPALVQAVRGTRISIAVLTKNYASSSWCLDELLEILKCKKEIGQIVIPVFYGVDPSHVRKQTGDFGIAFKKTCQGKTEQERQRWSQALTDVTKLGGYDIRNWDNETEMIKIIAKVVSDKLNASATPSKEFDGMVGLEAHLEKMQSLLQLDDDEEEAVIVGIYGPAGIGKTTIARALHSRLSHRFQLTCFMENIGRIFYNSNLDELQLKKQLLSNVETHNDTRIGHLGDIHESLRDKKVLVVLDDVNDLQQLEALADETSWFGPRPGSRIIVTTQDPEILRQHGIDITYHIDLPSDEEALKIFCRNAFKQSYPQQGFREIALRVTQFCGNLPLRLREVGLSLRGEKKEEWEQVLGVGYEPSSSNKPRRKSKKWCSTGMAFLVVINLLLEITSAVSDQLSSIRKPYFSRISLVMSILSVVLSILDLTYKIRAHRARFRWRWMRIPWFYYPERNYRRIFGSFTDNALLFCGVGQLIVSTINFSFIERQLDGPIKVSVWPLFFAIAMLFSKFMEKPAIYKES